MKHIKSGTILLVAVLLFFTFCLGMYLGRQSHSGELLLCTEKRAAEPVTEAQPAAVSVASEVEKVTENTEPVPKNTEILSGQVNITTASEEQRISLPGIGEKLAGRIIEYRETHGSFASVEDLMNVSGIGEKKLEALLEYITVEE